jgi:NDP-sugar pyrophosphorylase family protein
MKAFVLAAGKGTRLGQLTRDCPKCMLKLSGRPLLEYTINWLRSYGITELIINVHHFGENIVEYFGDGRKLGANIRYSEEKELLGTAGALDKMRDYLTERFLVVYGDLLTNIDLSRFQKWHETKGASLSMTVYHVEDPTRAGIAEMNSNGRLTRFREKPPLGQVNSNLANAGVFISEPCILNYIPHNTFFDIGHDLLPSLLRNEVSVYCYPITDYLLDIGSLERYRQAQLDLVRKGLFQ